MSVDANITFDATARHFDADGRLHISKSHISKATVNPYYGSEIPGYEHLGLDPQKVYYLFRDPKELARAASTFARLPILARHVPVSAAEHRPDLVIGAIGSDVEFNDPYLDADLVFWEQVSIGNIETDSVRELSCAYRYVPVMTPGEYNGQRYDGIMTEIVGNHLALVEQGRAGSDVLAADEAIKPMKTTKLGTALVITLGAMSPKLAQDTAFPALVAKADGKTLKVDELSAKIIAMDAELDPKRIKLAVDALLALDEGEEDEDEPAPPAQDCAECKAKDGKHAKDCKMGKDKRAHDAKEDEDKEESKKAMDAAIKTVTRELREANDARVAVEDVVGKVIAQDSAEGIYTFALDDMKVPHEGVTGVPALKALFSLAKSQRASAPAPRVAMDSAPVVTKFPNLSRFRQM